MPPPRIVEDRLSGYRYQARSRGSETWQIETHSDDSSHRIQRRAEYVVGSGNHALAWVAADSGFLTELPVGWFRTAGWRMNPGYELKNHRFSRPITNGCVGCHATTAVHEAPVANRFSLPIADGIDCTRCHGDAQQHIAFRKSPSDEPPPGAQLVRPGLLAADRANDLCLQCHLQGDVTVLIGQFSPLDYQPGQRLLDQRHDYFIAGQHDSLGIASHGARMLQSRCFAASGEKLTCILCHDPHRPAADFSADHYNAQCQTCHQPKSCTRPDNESQSSTASCIGCHMPKRPTREGVHLVFTDHAIRRRPVAVATAQPPIFTPNSQVQLVSAWPSAKPDLATLGSGYVLLHETMGPQVPSLARGRELLSQALQSNPADQNSRYWLGSALLALNRAAEARTEVQQVLVELPNWHEARYRLALAEEAAGNPSAAIAHYEQLLTSVPRWPEPHTRLAQLYLAREQPADATRVLRRLVALKPDAAAYGSLALAERLAGASHEQALTTIKKAIELDSREPSAYVARGTLHLLSGQPHASRIDFERTRQLDPANAAALQALRTLSLQP
jgi:tetratricopeptide (TPR) repeat protein